MPEISFVNVQEDLWKSATNGNTVIWDGMSTVWLNDSYTKKSLRLPVSEGRLSWCGGNNTNFMPPNLGVAFNTEIVPYGTGGSVWSAQYEKYVSYYTLSPTLGVGMAAIGTTSSNANIRGTDVWINFTEGKAHNLTGYSKQTLSTIKYQESASLFFYAIPISKIPSPVENKDIDGYYIGISAFVLFEGGEILNTPPTNSGDYIIDFDTSLFDARTYLSITSDAPVYPPEGGDPYNPGGNSGVGGGEGNFDNTTVPVDIPELPTLSAVDTGFISLYNPSLSQLNNLASYMWSDLFDLDTFKKIFADPMSAILGLSIVPVAVPNGGAVDVKIGNISTGVSMSKATTQYVSVDCGTLNVEEYWGAYLDYSPYTKAEIYLPYIGARPIDIDDVMKKSVHVVYHIDILSGACCAYVKCGESVLYTFVGQCTASIPITGNDWTNVINGALSIAASVGSMIATGGATAPMAINSIASSAVNNLKPQIEKSGSISGVGGMLGIQTPYLILTRPNQAKPENLNTYTGYPSYVTASLSTISGYTEIDNIHLENVPATEAELGEIETLLKGGVIF